MQWCVCLCVCVCVRVVCVRLPFEGCKSHHRVFSHASISVWAAAVDGLTWRLTSHIQARDNPPRRDLDPLSTPSLLSGTKPDFCTC